MKTSQVIELILLVCLVTAITTYFITIRNIDDEPVIIYEPINNDSLHRVVDSTLVVIQEYDIKNKISLLEINRLKKLNNDQKLRIDSMSKSELRALQDSFLSTRRHNLQ